MIFTNLTWGLSYVHLELGAKIVIRSMCEDSCKEFLGFWKMGLLLDIIVLPFFNCKQCWFCNFQDTGEPYFCVFCILKFVCLTICRQSAVSWAKHANLSDRLCFSYIKEVRLQISEKFWPFVEEKAMVLTFLAFQFWILGRIKPINPF
jgi:hypothetical protein